MLTKCCCDWLPAGCHKVFMVFWMVFSMLHRRLIWFSGPSIKIYLWNLFNKFIVHQVKMAKPYMKNRTHTSFTPSHSLFLSFSFIPQGKLVCCNAVDLLGDEKSPGPSTVTGLKWTLSAPNHIWKLALRLFLAPSPFLFFFFFFFSAVLWKARPYSDSLTS